MSYIYITTSDAYKSTHHSVCSHTDKLYLSVKYSELNKENSVHRRRRIEYIFGGLFISPVDSGVRSDPDTSEHLEGPQRACRASPVSLQEPCAPVPRSSPRPGCFWHLDCATVSVQTALCCDHDDVVICTKVQLHRWSEPPTLLWRRNHLCFSVGYLT